MLLRRSAPFLGAAALVLSSATAVAQEEPPAEEPTAAEEAPAEEPAAKEEPATKDAETAEAVAEAEAGSSPVEEPGKTYRFVGLRYRGIIVPKFMMNLFGDGGRTVYVHGFGPEFTIRKDAFEYVFSLWYAAYSMKDTPFKASSDGEDAWEIVRSEIKVLYLTSDFLWSHEFSPEFSLNYGMGAGFGFVFGNLYRNQAYPPNNTTDPYQYVKCPGPTQGNQSYCGTDNDHYGNYTEPSWANGGSKPIIFPWLALQTGLRYKPHKNFTARLDAGFGLSGFFFGLAGNYGL
ncbi:MAG: hypothetical protein H6717_22095 [Polyangiaceae bacterium]|nr:hypothetical protein [Polyangiaceae bacterium]